MYSGTRDGPKEDRDGRDRTSLTLPICGDEVQTRTKSTTRVPPQGKVLGLPWDAAGAYRDVEEEDAGAVLRHTKERKLLKV